MAPSRGDLGERRQGEAPDGHARVRQDRIGTAADGAREVEDVEVDLAGAVDEPRDASELALDRLQRGEETSGRAAPEDLGDGVVEIGLVGVPDGRGAIERGDAADGRDRTEPGESAVELGAAVAEIRAEADVDPPRRISTLPRSRRRGDCRRSLPLPRGRLRRRSLPPLRPEPPRPRIHSSWAPRKPAP